jgi:bifunctional UDP-N-acetylglucosamine pyrophosphorylase / glucosamine-1-phosphate N-acetyltransferase
MSILNVAIMAGGQGKRMRSNIPKFLHKIHNKEMIVYILEACLGLQNINKIYIILNPVIISQCNFLLELFPNKLEFVTQDIPKGTGHAVQCLYQQVNMQEFPENSRLLILNADMPNVQTSILQDLISFPTTSIMGARLDNPKGYGRLIINGNDNKLACIEEDKDCKDPSNNLCNMGLYCFCIKDLQQFLFQLHDNNASNEFYLTQIFDFIPETKVSIVQNDDIKYLKGVNTPEELAEISVLMI